MFNHILNVFADASINTKLGIACAGAMLYDAETNYQQYPNQTEYIVQINATNNSAEILAICGAINLAYVNMCANGYSVDSTIVNVFSDSKISLIGLREWLFDWVRRQSDAGVLYNSSGNVVANQVRFIDIVRMILDDRMNVRFIHQRGHVPVSKYNNKAMVTEFIKENDGFMENTSVTFGEASSKNDAVDKTTRYVVTTIVQCLKNGLNIGSGVDHIVRDMPNNGIYSIPFILNDRSPILYSLNMRDMKSYADLIGKTY